MPRVLVLVCSVAAAAVGWLYSEERGLILDVAVLRSIRLGDHLLLAGWMLAAIPLPFLGRLAVRQP